MDPRLFYLDMIAAQPGSVILDAQKPVRESRDTWLLQEPTEILSAHRADQVEPVLTRAQEIADKGAILAGFIAYEAAEAFGLATAPSRGDLPLVWLAVYHGATKLSPDDWPAPSDPAWSGEIQEPIFNCSADEYQQAVERVREWIASGDTYQTNLTCKCRFDLPRSGKTSLAADAFAYYRRLRAAHPVPYGAFLNLGDAQIVSLSPELFLHRKGDRLTTRPMKGTVRRGLGCREDNRLSKWLRHSEKNRAENVMIVDLMRNDLGRICETGSIAAAPLFGVERYRSVYQMTSVVSGKLPREKTLLDVMRAAFPCGSVTGAPKRRTMEIIRDLEREPRGPYCGAIGRIGPGRDFSFNVAIRTLVHRAGQCELGVGSGITWGSDPAEEWEETRLKTRFTKAAAAHFRLIETFLLRPPSPAQENGEGQYDFLDEHLARLAASARYWGFLYPKDQVLAALRSTAFQDIPDEGLIVRLTLDDRRKVDISTRALLPLVAPRRALLSDTTLDQNDPMLYHKTDSRQTYDDALSKARSAGATTDVLFRNRLGHLTEGSFTNIFLETDGQWQTPRLDDGLLPGLWRAHFKKQVRAKERSLTVEDLARADRVVIGNSVRGSIEIDTVEDESGKRLFSKL